LSKGYAMISIARVPGIESRRGRRKSTEPLCAGEHLGWARL